ncbi:MAG: hypothetical protein JXB24_12770 [Bacteroidales bacterium]|nr:hypothetical protein [Bacteroidales bacterium]
MMKKIIFLTCLCSFITIGNAQVFNTSGTLKPGKFSAGFEPGVYVNGETSPNLFLYAGAGIVNGLDFGLKLGLFEHDIYFGGDIEFALGKVFSLSAGAHSWGDFALDATGLLTFQLGKAVDLYTGLDMDVIFADDTLIPLWIPIGIEVPLKSYMLFLFETEINVTDVGSHYIGGGLNFLF